MRPNLVLALVLAGLASLARAQETPKEKPTGFIGIQMEAVAIEGSPQPSAIRVVLLVPGSPAEGVGLKPGDVITALDGQSLAEVPLGEVVQTFRERLKPKGPGEKVVLSVLRDAVTIETSTGETRVGTGSAWMEALPDLRRLVEENPGKVVRVSAERARWERDVTITLIARPGTRTTPLPENASLRPDLEALPYDAEAALASALVTRAGLEPVYQDLRRRLEDDEKVEDPYRLKTVRYLKRDPLRLPGATRSLGALLAKTFELAAVVSASGTLLDADPAAIESELAPLPPVPPRHSDVTVHVGYCLAHMRRARDLVLWAQRHLSPEEREALARDLPTLADKFEEHIYLHDDPDPARWKRHSRAIDVLARVERGTLLRALAELAPLAAPAYLEQLAQDLREVEGRSRFYSEYDRYCYGWILAMGTSDLGEWVVGGSGTNAYRGEQVLVIDLAGDDLYYRRAGGARGPERPVAVAIDLEGDDAYQATEPFGQGSAFLGVGLLVDRRGDDRYTSLAPFAQGTALAGAGALVDLEGNDVYRAGTYAQGAALAQGLGLLLDGAGRDEHEAGLYAQGFAGPGGLGALVDKGGNDHYAILGRKKCSYGEDGVFDAHGQGSSCGFRSKASGGIAALVDEGGDDVYEAGNFSQGCGYYFGWGALCDMGSGRDRYAGSRYAQAAAAHSALGSLRDEGGDDRYSAWVGAAQSLAWDLSATALTDLGGNDSWDGGWNLSQGASAHNGLSLFFDGSGKDSYRVHRKLPAQAGPNDYHGGQSLSFFIEAGGEENAYDVADGVAFVPSRGFTVAAEKTIFADLPVRAEAMGKAELEKLWPPR